MNISIIGAGRVAYHLAGQLKLIGQHIGQIYSQNLSKAQHLAQPLGAEAIDDYAALQAVDLLIIAVSDSAIAEVIQKVHAYLPQCLIVHTSGSTDLKVLTAQHARSGVLYPLQTFSLEREIDWLHTPIFIETAQLSDLDMLQTLARQLSERVYHYTSQQRLSLHLAAVFACNFTNYCYDMAKQVVDQQQVDFSLLYPLIQETAQKVTQHDPKQMQTGPAIRKDEKILKLHQSLLNDQPQLQEMYRMMSDGIMQRHHSE